MIDIIHRTDNGYDITDMDLDVHVYIFKQMLILCSTYCFVTCPLETI